MVDALRGLAAFIVAGLATTASLGHFHLPAQHQTPQAIHVQSAAPTLDVIAGEFVSGVPAKAAVPLEIPTIADNPPPPADTTDSGAAPVYSGPAYAGPGRGPAGDDHGDPGRAVLLQDLRLCAGLPAHGGGAGGVQLEA